MTLAQDKFLQTGTGAVNRTVESKLNDVVSVKDFGAVGDGVTDDTAAIQDAIDAVSGTLYLGDSDNEYLVDTLSIASGITIKSSGASLLLRTTQTRLVNITSNDVILDGITFDANGLEVSSRLIDIATGLTGWKVLNCLFKDLVGVTGNAQYGLFVTTEGCEGEIKGCTFKDISNYNPTQTPLAAFNGGLFVNGGATEGAESLVIDNCTFDNIWTDNINSDIDNSDSDGIRLYSGSGTFENNLQISNVYFSGVQKSAIKVSGCKGAQYTNIYVNGSRTDVPMVAGVRFQSSDDSVVTNVKCKGYMTRGINISSSNFLVNGFHFSPIDTATDTIDNSVIALQSSDSSPTTNVIVKDVIAYNITRLINFDTTGLTIDDGFVNITIDGVRSTYKGVVTLYPNLIRRCENITLSNISMLDPSGLLSEAWEFERCAGVRLNNVFSEFRRNATVFTTGGVGVSNVSFSNCIFVRPDSESGDTTYKSLELRYSDGTALTDIKLSNVEVSVPSYDTTSNQTIVKCNLIQSQINNLKMIIRDVGVANPGTACNGTFVDCLIDGVSLIGSGKTGTVYAVHLDSSSAENTIFNVRSDERGVDLDGDDSLVSNIAAFTTVVSDSGTGNTTGITHTFT